MYAWSVPLASNYDFSPVTKKKTILESEYKISVKTNPIANILRASQTHMIQWINNTDWHTHFTEQVAHGRPVCLPLTLRLHAGTLNLLPDLYKVSRLESHYGSLWFSISYRAIITFSLPQVLHVRSQRNRSHATWLHRASDSLTSAAVQSNSWHCFPDVDALVGRFGWVSQRAMAFSIVKCYAVLPCCFHFFLQPQHWMASQLITLRWVLYLCAWTLRHSTHWLALCSLRIPCES